MEKIGASWRHRLPALGSTVRLGVVWMVEIYTRLLNDPRALEARCTPVDKLGIFFVTRPSSSYCIIVFI
jgi:hypothetical protein